MELVFGTHPLSHLSLRWLLGEKKLQKYQENARPIVTYRIYPQLAVRAVLDDLPRVQQIHKKAIGLEYFWRVIETARFSEI